MFAVVVVLLAVFVAPKVQGELVTCTDGFQDHDCSLCPSNSTQNGLPGVEVAFRSGLVQVNATSFALDHMFIGNDIVADGANSCPANFRCKTIGADGCTGLARYHWSWSQITSNVSCFQRTADNELVSYTMQLWVVDNELSGFVFDVPYCSKPHRSISLRFSFPAIVSFAGTLVSGLSTLDVQSTLVDLLSYNHTATRLGAHLLVGLPYPYALANMPQCAQGTDCMLGVDVETETDPNCAASNATCIYKYALSIVGDFCDELPGPDGTYTLSYNVSCRREDMCPFATELHTLQFTIPSLYQCAPIEQVGSIGISLQSFLLNTTTNVLSPTTVFSSDQPITLVAQVQSQQVVTYAGHIGYVNICEKATLNEATNTPCTIDSTSSRVFLNGSGTEFDGFTYATSGNVSILADESYHNAFAVSGPNSSFVRVTLQLSSFSFLGDPFAATPVTYLRVEIEVVDLRFAPSSKKNGDGQTKETQQTATEAMYVQVRKAGSLRPAQEISKSDGNWSQPQVVSVIVGCLVCVLLVGLAVRWATKRIRSLPKQRARLDSLPLQD